MQGPRRGPQLGPKAEQDKCLEEELPNNQEVAVIEVRLRRTSRFMSLAPSCAHLQWACMVFLNEVGSLDPPFLFEEKVSPILENVAHMTQLQAVEAVISIFSGH